MRFSSILAGTLCVMVWADAQIQMVLVAEQEPNSSPTAPQILSPSLNASRGVVVYPATISPAGDRDYYQFRVDESGVYSLRVDTNRDTVLNLYNSAGTLIASNDNGGNPDIPNAMASGLSLALEPGDYVVEVRYVFGSGICRYALRLFPGVQAPDADLTEPNNDADQGVWLGAFTGGELFSDVGFSAYGGGDVDVYLFTSAMPISGLRIRTVTCIDTVLQVIAPDGTVYENDDSSWDTLNGSASEVYIPLGGVGTYVVEVRAYGRWGGYYRLQILAELPSEITLQDGGTLFRLRGLTGGRDRVPSNNADWLYGGADHLFQMGWWYRLQGINGREYTPSTLNMVGQEEPNRAFLVYQEPDGLFMAFRYELRALAAGGSILECALYAYNLRSERITLHLFHYFDPDVGGSATNLAEWREQRIRVQGANGHYAYLTPFPSPAHWEATSYPQTLLALTDSTPTTLSDGTMPFEGDLTGAFQWSAPLNQGGLLAARVHYALDTEAAPLQGDVDRSGCVDDSDLLAVLFAFGRMGMFLPEDVNMDGVVDDSDMLTVLFQFGAGC